MTLESAASNKEVFDAMRVGTDSLKNFIQEKVSICLRKEGRTTRCAQRCIELDIVLECIPDAVVIVDPCTT